MLSCARTSWPVCCPLRSLSGGSRCLWGPQGHRGPSRARCCWHNCQAPGPRWCRNQHVDNLLRLCPSPARSWASWLSGSCPGFPGCGKSLSLSSDALPVLSEAAGPRLRSGYPAPQLALGSPCISCFTGQPARGLCTEPHSYSLNQRHQKNIVRSLWIILPLIFIIKAAHSLVGY